MMLFLMAGLQQGYAQEMLLKKAVDSLQTVIDQNLPDSVKAIINDSTIADEELMKDINKEVSLLVDSTLKNQTPPAKDWSTWRPDPKRALWLALVIPGGGQIYNRKYWKLPIVYGGFLGCTYALTWNNMMLHDYQQAYLDIMDSDPATKSYEKMLPMGYDISGKEERFKTIFKNKKNHFRKYRDMSIFAFVGVYLISVIDAYVDAELSSFDISQDLSLHLEPATIRQGWRHGGEEHTSIGLQCSLTF